MFTMNADKFAVVSHPDIDHHRGHRLALPSHLCVVGRVAHRLTAHGHGWVGGHGSSRRLCRIVSARSRLASSCRMPSLSDCGHVSQESLDLARQSLPHSIPSEVGARAVRRVSTHILPRMRSVRQRRPMLNSRKQATRAPTRVLTCKVRMSPTAAVRSTQGMQTRRGNRSKPKRAVAQAWMARHHNREIQSKSQHLHDLLPSPQSARLSKTCDHWDFHSYGIMTHHRQPPSAKNGHQRNPWSILGSASEGLEKRFHDRRSCSRK